ncbi:type II secretion system protein [Massilia sp. 9I]|uniref:type II secretion system protein n=1 Tax=Massilia sp. 9I TaxID=2653152 RepID=UPI0012F29F70|nr:type II secretion system protein [Massilia sp. 9I]VXB21132.1 conserved hypothetical protein [Massilia sp. 9I]
MKSNVGRCSRQGGFTLVETTAVIAIVGALAATALPRVTGMTGEARYASLGSARAALSTVATMSNAKFLINGQTTQTLQDSTVTLVHGYPAATLATADAAGLTRDYVVYTEASGPGAIVLVPKGIAGTAKAVNCFLVYEEASAARPVPKISLGANTTAEACT